MQILNPGRGVICDNCAQYDAGVIFRRIGGEKAPIALCGRCLALALQEVTKQNWVSQFTLWQANQRLGKEIQEGKKGDRR